MEFLCATFQHQENIREEIFLEIYNAYNSGSRHYHNLNHISSLLQTAEHYKDLIKDYESISFAIWFHDIVYKATATDNEEQSSVTARKLLLKLNVPEGIISKVNRSILATKNHSTHGDADNDLCLFLDFDLKILGENREDYEKYMGQIRKEYWLIPDFLYNPGRKKVLAKFLGSESIFKTNEFRLLYEKIARENIQFEMEKL